MKGTNWAELAGAVVTIIIALAGYLRAQSAHARINRIANGPVDAAHRRLDNHIFSTPHPQSQIAEAESTSGSGQPDSGN